MCEIHQRAYWRNQKAAKRPTQPAREPKPRAKQPRKAERRCKKTLTVDYKRGLLKEQQITKLGELKQLDILVSLYRAQGYKVVEKR